MSVDADRTVNMANSFHDMWRFLSIYFAYLHNKDNRHVYNKGKKLPSFIACINLSSKTNFVPFSLPLQIGMALYLLYTQVQFAFVAGITITILLIPGRVSLCYFLYIY